MDTSPQALRPCPFCGSSAHLYPDGDMEGHAVLCSGDQLVDGRYILFGATRLHCPLSAFGFATEADAITAWNQRAAPSREEG